MPNIALAEQPATAVLVTGIQIEAEQDTVYGGDRVSADRQRFSVNPIRRCVLTIEWFQRDAPNLQEWLSTQRPLDVMIDDRYGLITEEVRRIENYVTANIEINVGQHSLPEFRATVNVPMAWNELDRWYIATMDTSAIFEELEERDQKAEEDRPPLMVRQPRRPKRKIEL